MESKKFPKIIKRKKSKRYTEKRSPYKSYICAKWEWIDIFHEIDKIKKSDNSYIKTISTKYGIKYNTLANKYRKYRNNNNTFINTENRGGSNKIFDIDSEKELYDLIKKDYIDKNNPLNNNIIKQLAINNFENKNKQIQFNASDGWCNMFKKRWNLSTQRVKPNKIATNIPTDDDITEFLDTYKKETVNVKKSLYLIMMRREYIS